MPLGNPIRKQNESRIISVLATEGQSVFTVEGGYIINQISVFRNGVRLSNSEDFTAGDGSTVTLNNEANIDDRIEFHIFDTFTVNNSIVSAASTQTISGDLVINGKIFGNLDVPSINTGILTATNLNFGKGDISGDFNVAGVTTVGNGIDVTGGVLNVTNSNQTLGILSSTDDGANLDLFDNDTQSRIRTVNGQLQFRADVGNNIADSSIKFFVDADNERVRIKSDGKVGIGETNPQEKLHVFGGNVKFENTTGNSLTIQTHVNNGNDSTLKLEKSRGGTSETIVQDNDDLGMISWGGYDGSAYQTGAHIFSEVDGTPASGDMPTRMVLATRTAGAGQPQGRITIGSTGSVSIINDLVISDTIVHSGDGNTKIRFPANDNISFETNSQERLRIQNSGKILVGHTTARATAGINSPLQIQGTDVNTASLSITRNSADDQASFLVLGKTRGTSNGAVNLVNNDDVVGAIRFAVTDGTDFANYCAQIKAEVGGPTGINSTPGRLMFLTTSEGQSAPTERLRIASDGRSTFYGTNEQDIIHLSTGNSAGNTFANVRGDNEAGIRIRGGGSSNGGTIELAGGLRDTDPGIIKFSTGTSGTPTERLRITSAGKVGINTDNPSRLLEINTTGTSTEGIVVKSNDNTYPRLDFGANRTNADAFLGMITANWNGTYVADILFESGSDTTNKDDGLISFRTAASGGTREERLRITSDGRIGLNVTNPNDYELDIYKRSGETNAQMRLYNNATGSTNDTILRFQIAGTTADNYIYFGDGDDSNVGTMRYNHDDDFMSFAVNANTRLKIDSFGRMLVGLTTPMTTGSNDGRDTIQAVHTAGAQLLLGRNDTGVTNTNRLGEIAALTNDSGGTGFKVGATIRFEADSTMSQDDYPTAILFKTCANSSATLTTRIRIKSNGDLVSSSGASSRIAFGSGDGTLYSGMGYYAGGNQDVGLSLYATTNAGVNFVEHFRMEHNGTLKATDTSIGSLSDIRLKKNIADYSYDISKFKQFKPKSFDWINPEVHGDKSNVKGFIAQDIETVDGDWVEDSWVSKDDPDFSLISETTTTNGAGETVGISKISKFGYKDAMYISVIQQLIGRIETLESKVATLEGS